MLKCMSWLSWPCSVLICLGFNDILGIVVGYFIPYFIKTSEAARV